VRVAQANPALHLVTNLQPPGWIVLGRAFDKLLVLEQGLVGRPQEIRSMIRGTPS
jgi:hypothetical protein